MRPLDAAKKNFNFFGHWSLDSDTFVPTTLHSQLCLIILGSQVSVSFFSSMVYMLVNQLKYHQLLISFSASQNTGATRGTTKVNLICQSKVMAMPGRIQTTLSPLPHTMVCHVAVTWNNATLIWGGLRPNLGRCTVLQHIRGKWTTRETSGDLPTWVYYRGAQVVNDKMIVFGPNKNGGMYIHCLDLHSWIWTKLSPRGNPCSKRSGASSWAHKGKIYYFGGHHDKTANNQVVSYNISTNSWEWPNARGDIPSPRSYPLITISDDTVFLFGGDIVNDENSFNIYNDLYILDMTTMTWRKIHGNFATGEGPKAPKIPLRMFTFTSISQYSAVLFGVSFDNPHKMKDECWVLNLRNAKQLVDLSSIWTKIEFPYPRFHHAAVLQPLSKRLWVIGGDDGKTHPSTIMKLNFNQLRSLKNLALDCVARNICAHDPRLAPEDQMTRQLRNEIEAYKCEIGDQYSCPDEDWRNGCPLEERWKSNGLPSA